MRDTYNLLSDGIVKLVRALSEVERSDLDEWAAARGYERYVGSSVKGDACIDWDDKKARAALLGRIVGDADRLLELSRRTQGLLDEDSTERQRIVEASELLEQLLLQDVERIEEGVGLKEGVSRDRIVSVHDPEMRHGHKSSSKRFDGHKASVAVDTDSQVITAVDVLPGNASGCWHLADFGIARYAEATTASDAFKYFMTPAYAAPEQWRGERATSATDVYAFGVVAHELLAGERPFDRPDYRHQHLEESPKAMIGIPEKLRSLVGECLYKGPGARPLPQNLLARLRASMGAASPAGARLQQANAVAVELRAEAARQQSAAHAEADRRGELYADADRSLANMLAMLDRQIKDNAPAVWTSSDPYLNRWELNNAAVWVNFPAPVGLGRDRGLPFEVIAHTKISVSGSADRSGYTGRSHSLWYCDAQEKGTFRWYETAFMETFGTNTPFAPSAMSPEASDTAKALSPALHTYQVAWPFMPIDQGDEGSFVERWMSWFGEAAQGQLRYPGRSPEVEPHSSWRRGS